MLFTPGRRIALLPALLIVLVLAGCQTPGLPGLQREPVSPPRQSSQSAPSPAGPESLPPDQSLQSGPGAIADTELSFERPEPEPPLIQEPGAPAGIALLLPLSGQRASVGQAMLDAAQMALFDIAGEDYNLMVYDTQGTPNGAEDAARLAVADGARLILGPLYGRSAEAVRPIVAEAGINAVAFSNDRSVAGPPVYLMGLMPAQQIERVIRYAVGKGYRRIGLLLPHGGYGDLVLESARSAAFASGAEITRIAYYDSLASDFTETARAFAEYDSRRESLKVQKDELAGRTDEISRQTLARLETMDTLGDPPYDAVLIPEGGNVLRSIAPLLAFYDVDTRRVKLLGTAQWEDPSLGTEPSLVGGWFSAPPALYRENFALRYEAAFGRQPSGLAALAYDSIALSVSLQRGEAGADFGGSALTAESGFVALNGLFRFAADGSNQRGLAIFEIKDRALEQIDSAPERFDDLTN
ncbi:penicillin-binding protein activator [Nisaea acidiphila]|uniref:Penicillin-binding protein activator n=1 Tax=Nisaea acidiphila TaxID=1862145 RepID=A0A9J7AZG1_9PROT|nr:penicillin-binding protein activator [Nisaea acidiphila]UUX52162.1 penicillin-binding protein activator [Nisaea acidiphila]